MRALRKRRVSHFGVAAFAVCATAAGAGFVLAQEGDQQLRCMQLQQELAVAQGGGGRGGNPEIDRQIAEANRVYQGTKAAMEDAGCFERFLIFGQGLVRSPKCVGMNRRAEDARRQLEQLQGQRGAAGGGNRRRVADLQAALARNGCGRAVKPQQARQERWRRPVRLVRPRWTRSRPGDAGPGLSQHRSERPLSLGLRQDL